MTAAIATVGGIQQLFHYDAYGNLLNISAAQAATNILYSGQMLDPITGLYDNRARWYDPATGRFDSLDPFFGDLQDPLSLHKYLYGGADPVDNIDPTGEILLPFLLAGAIAGGFIGAYYGINQGYDTSGILMSALVGAGIGALAFGLLGAYAPISLTTGLKLSILFDSLSLYFGFNMFFDTRNQLDKYYAAGSGGYRADTILPKVRNAVIGQWDQLQMPQKEQLIDELHDPSSGLSAWDITDLAFGNKAKWTQGVLGEVAHDTLTYHGKVYPVADVNYVLWGLINGLAYRDGIRTQTTGLYGTVAYVGGYRALFGTGVQASQLWQDGSVGDFETIAGKARWAEYGWEWANSDAPAIPTDDALPYAIPNPTPWPHSMSFYAGASPRLINGIVQ